ncbi:MAG: hypothetical protein O7C59_04325, partial [Rickettsia endosymbiont of Ixodes persulcatus]|nr:hypothetical protein [Rickettsia endosymbiont of Ixodes persulcatus]
MIVDMFAIVVIFREEDDVAIYVYVIVVAEVRWLLVVGYFECGIVFDLQYDLIISRGFDDFLEEVVFVVQLVI